MKITSLQYAKALYEAASDKGRSEIDVFVSNLAKILTKSRQQKLLPNILVDLTDIHDKEAGRVAAEVTTKKPLEKESREQVMAFIREKYSAKEVSVRNIVDEKIGGGMIVRVGDEVLDGGIARQLEELRINLVK